MNALCWFMWMPMVFISCLMWPSLTPFASIACHSLGPIALLAKSSTHPLKEASSCCPGKAAFELQEASVRLAPFVA